MTVAVAALLLSGCSSTSFDPPASPVPSTDRAIAAIAIEQLGETVRFAEPTQSYGNLVKPFLGADLHLTVDGHKGLVTVFVIRKLGQYETNDCSNRYDNVDGCISKRLSGGPLVVQWQYREPEEDSGQVTVISTRRDDRGRIEYVEVGYSGADITKSPLKGGIPIPIERLEAVAASPAMGFTTSPDSVEKGRKLSGWRNAFAG